MRSNDGSLRGNVARIIKMKNIPPQTKTNDGKMRKQCDNLYGNTKLTDEQVLYFYVKHGKSSINIQKELKFVSLATIRNRLAELGVTIDRKKRFNSETIRYVTQAFNIIIKNGAGPTQISKKLKIPLHIASRIYNELDVTKLNNLGMSDKVFKTIFKNCPGKNKHQKAKYMAKLIYDKPKKSNVKNILRKVRELKIKI